VQHFADEDEQRGEHECPAGGWLGFQLYRVALARGLRERGFTDLRDADWALVRYLHHSGCASVTEIARHYDVTKQAASQLIVASSVTVSPEGAHVYVTDPANNAVVVFARDSGTGLLTHVDTTTGAGLGFANALALSPDGAHVYVSAASSSAVTLFDRSSATGILTFVESYPRPPAGPGPLLSDVRAVAVSPDGDHVYAAASDDNALTAFRRNPADGRLTFVESDFSPDANVVALAISPRRQVYVAISLAHGDRGVATYTRSVATGALTLLETLHERASTAWSVSPVPSRWRPVQMATTCT
jgi:6-phosphogluconolactonase (cycloisomerase 2 family)